MSTKWFVSKNETIQGPLSADDIKSRVQSGQLDSSYLVWGAGMDQWQRIEWWNKELPRLSTMVHAEPIVESWHYALGGKSHGPFKRDFLIEELKHLPALNDIMLWTKGMKEWAPLFEFHDILSAVGVNKRQFPRADLTGKAVLKWDGNTLEAPLLSISEGGLGLQLDSGLEPGTMVNVEIQSQVFRTTMQARVEVRYVASGVAGLRFMNASSELKSAIIQYVRQNQPRFVLKAA
jgi:hypothetical protein